MKNQSRYCLQDGRIILSPVSLDYAISDCGGTISLSRIKPSDMKKVAILPANFTGNVICLYSEGGEWKQPDVAVKEGGSYHRHYSIQLNGEPYIYDGKYIPLTKFIKNASAEELAFALTQVATQAALAQLELATHTEHSA